jgi:hypothetical protein
MQNRNLGGGAQGSSTPATAASAERTSQASFAGIVHIDEGIHKPSPMAPRISILSSAAGWRCPQCASRTFTTSAARQKVGPEHPKYIEIPEPPQQTARYLPRIKGTLPVPRNVFTGGKDHTTPEHIAQSTPEPRLATSPSKGSREDWKYKMSESRRRNLREGIVSLKERQVIQHQRSRSKAQASQRAREQALHQPEREDERLTAPSINFDVDALMHKGATPDPSREERLRTKKANVERIAAAKREKRLNDLHTLYMNAREFIVTPEQLDKHVDEVFGKDAPVVFGTNYSTAGHSIWATGKPVTVQEMLGKRLSIVNTVTPADARLHQLAEALTGGKMDME